MSKSNLTKKYFGYGLNVNNWVFIIFLLFLMLTISNLNAQSPKGIGKFKISNYTLDSLYSQYDFAKLEDSMNNYMKTFDVYVNGDNRDYEIFAGDGVIYSRNLSTEDCKVFNISNYSVAGLKITGINLYFYKGNLYEVSILNNIKPLLEKLIVKYPNIDTDNTKTEKKMFQNSFGAVVEKENISREGNWITENGIFSKFFDNFFYDDQGDLQHIEQIMIYDETIFNMLNDIEDKMRAKKRKREEQLLKDEIINSDL